MNARAAEIDRAGRRLVARAPKLQALGPEYVCKALAGAASLLASSESDLGKALRVELRKSSGLSLEMIEWCVTTTLSTASEAALLELAKLGARRGRPPHALASVVLAGNICTAALRALYLPLLSGSAVLAKASSHDDVLPRALVRALQAVDAEVAQSIEVVRFGRDDITARDALLSHAGVISVYGDDETVAEFSAHAPKTARVLAHGHGLSALYIAPECLSSVTVAKDAAQRAALDIAAYDQRGCLSPHFAFVSTKQPVRAAVFTKLLSEALTSVEALLPRGILTADEKAACLQWRAVAATRGELLAQPTHAVSFEGATALRPSCGARHASVYEIDDVDALAKRLQVFGEHLKCIGVAGTPETRAAISGSFASSARPPRLCRAGEMQTPPFDAEADGLPALEGFFER